MATLQMLELNIKIKDGITSVLSKIETSIKKSETVFNSTASAVNGLAAAMSGMPSSASDAASGVDKITKKAKESTAAIDKMKSSAAGIDKIGAKASVGVGVDIDYNGVSEGANEIDEMFDEMLAEYDGVPAYLRDDYNDDWTPKKQKEFIPNYALPEYLRDDMDDSWTRSVDDAYAAIDKMKSSAAGIDYNGVSEGANEIDEMFDEMLAEYDGVPAYLRDDYNDDWTPKKQKEFIPNYALPEYLRDDMDDSWTRSVDDAYAALDKEYAKYEKQEAAAEKTIPTPISKPLVNEEKSTKKTEDPHVSAEKAAEKASGKGGLMNSAISNLKQFAGMALIGDTVRRGVSYASDLQEVQNVVDTAFGESSKEIDAWSKNALKAYGLNEVTAKRYSSTMGAMLKSSGLSGDAVTDMSEKITGLSADMASFYNLDTDEAFEKVRSGISGETEPLKQLGINMSVANLEAYAMSQGIDKSYNSMSQAEQTMLRYNYLLSTTGDAQGDFSRTSGSFANQLRTAKESWTALTGSLAQNVIPILSTMLSGLIPIIQGICNVAAKIPGIINNIASFVSNNWSIISPILFTVLGILAVYKTRLLVLKGIELGAAAVKRAMAFASGMAALAQGGLNTALQACPLVWIIDAIMIIIGAIYLVVGLINKCAGTQYSATGIICGCIAVIITAIINAFIDILKVLSAIVFAIIAVKLLAIKVIYDVLAFVVNIIAAIFLAALGLFNSMVKLVIDFGILVANTGIGIVYALLAIFYNFKVIIVNIGKDISSFFYGIVHDVISGVEEICKKLNSLPFVSFDYSGITAAADEYARKSDDAAASRLEYKDIGDAFMDGFGTIEFKDPEFGGIIEGASKGFNTMSYADVDPGSVVDAASTGWNVMDRMSYSDAWDTGYNIGEGIEDKVGGMFGGGTEATDIEKQMKDLTEQQNKLMEGMNDTTDDIKGSLDVANSNLKYLKDYSTSQAINRYTSSKQIKIDMTNNNSLNNGTDIDSVVSALKKGLVEAMNSEGEGAYA